MRPRAERANPSVLLVLDHVGVAVMTPPEDDEAVVQALRAGARGDIVKGTYLARLLTRRKQLSRPLRVERPAA